MFLASVGLFLAASSSSSSSSFAVNALAENQDDMVTHSVPSSALRGAYALVGEDDQEGDGDKSWLWGGEREEEDKSGYMFYQNFDIRGDANRAR